MLHIRTENTHSVDQQTTVYFVPCGYGLSFVLSEFECCASERQTLACIRSLASTCAPLGGREGIVESVTHA